MHPVMTPMKLLLVDDHPVLRDALAMLLQQEFHAVTLLAAGSLGEAQARLREHPDLRLVLLDLGLPDASGLHALVELRRDHEAATIVVLSAERSAAVVIAAIDAGAAGFVPKTSSSREMIAALRHVLAGGVYLPDASANLREDQPAGLSPRQTEVLRLLVQGKPNKLICRELGLSESTVKTHLAAIFERLGVNSRTQAVVAAARSGWRLGGP